jgi:hypothetical protein
MGRFKVKLKEILDDAFDFASGGFLGNVGPMKSGMMSGGGYLKQLRKFHDWNGTVPGAYGQEVGAILRAGTEGVYDTDYVNALRNGTMNTTSTNNKNINIGSVQMTFTEPVKNGRQVFDEFKALISFENNASSSRINLGVGA